MITDEPIIDWLHLVGGLLLAIGALFFLGVLHVLSLSFPGSIAEVMRTLFTVSLWLYIAGLIFGFSGVIIQLFRWLTWQVTTPAWAKEERRGGKIGR